MQIQTVFRAGNSDVVTIPKFIGDDFGIKTGQKVIVDKAPNGEGILIRRVDKTLKAGGTKVGLEFKKWLKKALVEDKEILDELALR
jgi:antitoxin component of MazEF toxin-antitoxin module